MFNNLKKTLNNNQRNILLVICIVIIVYFICKYCYQKNKEGFEDRLKKEVVDLLDKININEYAPEPLWNNKLYNNQPNRKELALSIWSGMKVGNLNDYKLIGHTLGTNDLYESPETRTMLIKGDTKPPEDSKLLFEFPHNFFTLPKLDENGFPLPEKNVYQGLKTYEGIQNRLRLLKAHYKEIQKFYEIQMEYLENARLEIDEENNKNIVEVCGSESFFLNPVITKNVKHGTKYILPQGDYNSLRVPIGSKIKMYSTGGGAIELDLNLESILEKDETNAGLIDKYREDDNLKSFYTDNNITENDFNPYGIYGFSMHSSINKVPYPAPMHNYTPKEPAYGIDDETSRTENIDDNSRHSSSSRYSYNRGFNADIKSVPFDHNSGWTDYIGNSGRKDLFNYLAKAKNNPIKGGTINIGTNSVSQGGSDKSYTNFHKYHNIKGTETNEVEIETNPTKIIQKRVIQFMNENSDWYDNDLKVFLYKIERPDSEMSDILNIIPEFKDCQSIFSSDIIESSSSETTGTNPSSTDANSTNSNSNNKSKNCDYHFYDYLNNNKIEFINYVYDMAFSIRTWQRKLKRNTHGDSTNWAGLTDEHVHNREGVPTNVFQYFFNNNSTFGRGRLKTAEITVNYDRTRKPELQKFNIIDTSLQNAGSTILNNIEQKINALEQLLFKIDNNDLEHFPMKIYRTIAPRSYISLGDIIFNHEESNFNTSKPVISQFATVPQQCVKAVRDWQMTDKVYTYDRDDKYLSLFLNPYTGTFFAVTQKNTLPPGKLNKVVACVGQCELLDNLIQSDKCSKKFYEANKNILKNNSLDLDSKFINKESKIYDNKIQNRQNQIEILKEISRRLQIQDDKANIVNKEYNKSKLNNLLNVQRNNINHLTKKLKEQSNDVNLNVKFDLVKFINIVNNIPIDSKLKDTIINEVSKKLENVDIISEPAPILDLCPDVNTEGLVRKALVESGCYNCTNLQ